MISSLSSRHERVNIGNKAHRTSLDLASASLNSKIGQEGKKKVSKSPSFNSRESAEIERRRADDKSLSTDELSLGKLPDQSEILKASTVMKLCQEEWQPRCICLTGMLDYF